MVLFSFKFKNKKFLEEVINLGTGYEISIKKLIELSFDISGKKKFVKIDPTRKRQKSSEVYRLKASNRKAKKLLNWKPKYKGINGLKKLLK